MPYKTTLAATAAILIWPLSLFASGNYPEAGACPPEKPYYAVCTHSLHSLEGWVGDNCYATREAAEKEAKAHADKVHKGNMRWTGVTKMH
jgi:hypothetical protein